MGCQLSKRRSSAYQVTKEDKSGCHGLARAAASPSKKPKACGREQPACTTQQQLIKAGNTPAAAVGKATAAAAAAGPAAKPKLDPKDFMFMQLTGKTCVKLPGSINGQQFIIDGCEGCELYVMDACAMVTIDDCKDCRIFIGPTESSVFVRNCNNCQLVCITRQLRTRDCQGCSVLLRSRTRPISESSAGIALGCYCTPYAGVAKQMAAVQLSPLHNFWSDMFDFTPAEGAAADEQGSKHWRLLPAGTRLEQHMGQLPEEVQQLLGQVVQQDQQEVPLQEQQSQEQQAAAQQLTEQDRQAVVCTAGALCSLQDIPEGCFAFLLFPPRQHASVLQWLAMQFPCPESNSSNGSLATGHSSNSRSGGTDPGAGADITAVDDITLKERPNNEQGSATAAVVAGADTASLASVQVQRQQQQQQQPLLLRTNEAAVPADVYQQIAAAAKWNQAQLQQFNGGHTAAAKMQKQDKRCICYIGVEVSCSSVEQQSAVCSSAVPLGALACSSLQAAKLFRNLGTDG